jgi:hypothetical protein
VFDHKTFVVEVRHSEAIRTSGLLVAALAALLAYLAWRHAS